MEPEPKKNTDAIVTARHTSASLAAGQLHEAEWQKASPVMLDRYWSGEEAPAGRHAETRILWSKEALHIRFVGRQAEPLIISATPQTTTKTMGLWDRDVCEIFIAPDPQVVERYFEFEAAPTGEWLDVAIDWSAGKRKSDWEFQSYMTTAAQVERDRITIGIRIPWDHWIHEPHRGERWRVNLFRCIGVDPGRGYLTWQPTRTKEANFHVPQVFGWLVFK